ncbi:MAG: ABC transporter permease subunit [Anaerolineae bacterium]|nr:ABC transporter permease subunit [Anaerolineae bacterium]
MIEQIQPALVIARREVRDQLRDWRIIFPVAVLTVFFPFLMNFTAQQMLGFVNRYGADIIGERLIPFLLMIVGFFPISVSLVIALESFVGEKERGSIEPLLNTPLKDWQLYLGKLLSSTVPPLFSSFLGMSVYLFGLYLQGIPWPEGRVLFLIIILTIVQAVVMVSGAVVVSSQATSVRAANLLASFIIIPVALLVQGESILMFWGTYSTLWWAVGGLVVLAVLLVRVGLAHFQREELLGREIDVLNIRWIGRIFWRSFTGGAKDILEWYRLLFGVTLRRLWPAILIVTLLAGIAYLLGTRLISQFFIELDAASLAEFEKRVGMLVQAWPLFEFKPVLAIWWHNVRVLLAAVLLGWFSLGVLGVLPLMLSLGAAGYLMAVLSVNGLPTMQIVAFVLPHGILEIPAAILATASVLQMGAWMGTPTPGKTVGEVWLTSLADLAKLMVGIVLPLAFAAALIEAWITPRVVMWVMR